MTAGALHDNLYKIVQCVNVKSAFTNLRKRHTEEQEKYIYFSIKLPTRIHFPKTEVKAFTLLIRIS